MRHRNYMTALRAFSLLLVVMGMHPEVASSGEADISALSEELRLEVQPISELPPNIRFKEDAVSMRVDYAAAKDGNVPIYRVNATEHSIPWVPSSWSLIIRETRAEDGTWYRCDRLPDDASYWVPKAGSRLPEIPPMHFYRTSSRINSGEGPMRPIRFVLSNPQGDLSDPSNVGMAAVDLEEAALAMTDVMRGGRPTFDELALLALGKIKLPERFKKYEIPSITRLGDHQDHPRRVPVLKQVAAQAKRRGDLERYRLAIHQLVVPESLNDHEIAAIRALLFDPCHLHFALLPGAYDRWYRGHWNRVHPRWDERAIWAWISREVAKGDLAFRQRAVGTIPKVSIPVVERMAFLERIIAQPRHPLLEGAIRAYGLVAEASACRETLEGICQSRAYSRESQDLARIVLHERYAW